MFRVGLTGGIASGKSTISQLFSELGVTVIDTDTISHQLMQPEAAAYLESVAHFGQSILLPDQTINREQLRKIVFNQPQEKVWLEQMIHPLIRESAEQAMLDADNQDYVLLVVPLMFETGYNKILDHVVAIDCPAEVQKQRLVERDTITASLADKMLAAQLQNNDRLSRADSIIDNQRNIDPKPQVISLHHKLLKLAQTMDN